MLNDQIDKIQSVFDELKDFQTETVDFAYNRLQKNNRYLVADEVGLGKTKIAKGVIAKALQERINSGSKKPFRVFYICSNQALAAQNLRDLNIFNDDNFINPDLNRLIYLAKKQDGNDQFSLSSLTPSTSFKITWGGGVQWERMLIYTVLELSGEFKTSSLKYGLKWLLIEGVTDWENWLNRIDDYYSKNYEKIIPGVPEGYIKKLEEIKITDDLNVCLDEIQGFKHSPSNLFELVNAYADSLSYKKDLDVVNIEYKLRNKVLIHLRKALIEVSLEYIEADLFILDEFQRFKELTGQGRNKDSEASKIANKIFSIKGAKCLLLSATPFKMYTTRFDEIEEEDHYSELLELLSFLNDSDAGKIDHFKQLRKKYFHLIKELDYKNSDFDKIKSQLEKAYKNVLCRTEKIIVSKNHNSLIIPKDKTDSDICIRDLENFVHTDRTFQTLIKKHNQKIRYSIDYSKSVPYPLSFMDGYKSKRKLNDFLEANHKDGNRLIKAHKNAWINLDHINNYRKLEIPNAKFRKLQQESIDKDDMWKLLWLPPSVPYYPGMGVYEGKRNLSKMLIFSKWVMVPKMISGLISYEVERRTIPNAEREVVYTPMRRTKRNNKKLTEIEAEALFEEQSRRKPQPILRLQLKNEIPSTMRSFTLLYPSKTLTNLFNTSNNANEFRHYKEIREKLANELEPKIKLLESKYVKNEGVDKDWYWIAPILLDREYNSEAYKDWVEKLEKHSITYRKSSIKKDFATNNAAIYHLGIIKSSFNVTQENSELGKMPDNLLKILIDIALGAPANCLLRIYERYFDNPGNKTTILNEVLDLAYDFMLFFDKPEAIATVQFNEEKKDKRNKENKNKVDIYWNSVLRYCIDGNIQSVLDEYCHMIYEKNRLLHNFTEAIKAGLNIRTSSVKVEGVVSTNSYKIKSKALRCHYAVSFGNQKLETEGGRTRATDLINNFNSPFRPFVLASTSIGQEGLDFHYYCRKIMHWNLPYNPVELEQREGRINRYKGLVIRQNIAAKFKAHLKEFSDIWKELFEIAENEECHLKKKAQIIPYWFIEPEEGIGIERIVPLLPYSIDQEHYKELITVLTLYRLTFGQPGQEELTNFFKKSKFTNENIDDIYNKLILNLSPLK